MSNFTNSPLINLTNLSPHRNSPRNQPIRKITIHHFAGNATIESVSNFLRQPGRNASYNYGIGTDGRIVLIVNERDRCWGSSSPANDHQAVVIGVANNTLAPQWGVSDTAFEALIRLCRCICERNNITEIEYTGAASGNLTRHNFFANTLCPGPFLQSRLPEIMRRINDLLGAEATAPPAAETPQTGVTIRVRRTRANNEIVTLDIEEYLRGVVPAEVFPSWGMEALKAQAVAARSFAMQRMERNRNNDFDVDDTTQFQAYIPDRIHPRTDEAIRETAGIIATFNGRIAETLYSASNGGETVSAQARWGGAGKPYLIAQQDHYTKRPRNGHGVGLSQWGAMERAQAGHTYADILAFYYPGTVLAENYNRANATAKAPAPATPPQEANTAPPQAASTSIDDIAREVIRGRWGNGQDRRNRLAAAGHDPSAVQARVNEMLR